MELSRNGLKRQIKQISWLAITAYTLFGLVIVAVGLTIAYFNGIDLWPWHSPPQSNYQLAVNEFKTAIDLEPGNPEGYRWLARAYTLAGKKDDAEAVFKQALENNPGKAWPPADLGQFYLDQERIEEAITQFQQAIETEPDYARAYSGLAQAYQNSGQNIEPDALIQLYQDMVANNPDQAWPYRELGNAYLAGGNVDLAVEAFKQAVAVEPDNPELQIQVGDIYRWNLNQLDQAIVHYRLATTLDPASAWYRAVLGGALYAAGQPDAGQFELDLALRLEADSSTIQQMVGDVMLEHRSSELAAPYYETAINLDPINAKAHLGLARAYQRQKNYDQALEHVSKAISIQDPGTIGNAYFEQGFIYADQENYDQAAAQILQALNVSPNNPWYQAQAGNFYMNSLQQPQTALDYYRRALELAPYNFWYDVFLGRALFATAQPAEGFEALDTALALTEDDARVYLAFGEFLTELEQWDLVVQVYEQALAQGIVDNASIYQGLGDAYKMLGNHPKALANYRWATNLTTNDTPDQ